MTGPAGAGRAVRAAAAAGDAVSAAHAAAGMGGEHRAREESHAGQQQCRRQHGTRRPAPARPARRHKDGICQAASPRRNHRIGPEPGRRHGPMKSAIAGHSAITSSRWAPPPQATALPRAQPAPDPPKHQIPRSPSSAKCAEPGRQPKVSAKITGRLQVSAKITGRRRKQAAGKPLKVKALTCGARVTAQPEARSNRSKASILGPCIGAFRFEASLGKIVARLYKNDAETKGEAKCPMPNADGLLKMILRCAFVPAGSSQAIGRTCTIVLAYLSSPARPLTRRPASATS